MKEEDYVYYGNFISDKEFLDRTGLLNKKKRILEIGCGKGSMVNHLKQNGHEIIGIDTNEDFIKKSMLIYGNLPIKKMSGDNLEFKENSFDIVLSFDVFEHIADSDKHLQEVKRVLKPKGYYLLQTPNKITNIPWEVLQRRSLVKWKKYHCSLHSFFGIKKRFRKNGFSIRFIKIKIINDFSLAKVKEKLGTFGLLLFKTINVDNLPLPFKTNFYIIARKEK